jgi:hypothetical protein
MVVVGGGGDDDDGGGGGDDDGGGGALNGGGRGRGSDEYVARWEVGRRDGGGGGILVEVATRCKLAKHFCVLRASLTSERWLRRGADRVDDLARALEQLGRQSIVLSVVVVDRESNGLLRHQPFRQLFDESRVCCVCVWCVCVFTHEPLFSHGQWHSIGYGARASDCDPL